MSVSVCMPRSTELVSYCVFLLIVRFRLAAACEGWGELALVTRSSLTEERKVGFNLAV